MTVWDGPVLARAMDQRIAAKPGIDMRSRDHEVPQANHCDVQLDGWEDFFSMLDSNYVAASKVERNAMPGSTPAA